MGRLTTEGMIEIAGPYRPEDFSPGSPQDGEPLQGAAGNPQFPPLQPSKGDRK